MRLQDQRTARAGRERNNLRGIPDSRRDPDLRAVQRASTRGQVSTQAPGEAFGVGVSQGTNPWEAIAQESRRALGYLSQWTKQTQQTADATTLAQVSTDVTEWKINKILGLRNEQGAARAGSTLRAHSEYIEKYLSDKHLAQFPERLRPAIAGRYKSEIDDFLTKMAREEYDYNEKFRNESMSSATEALIQEAMINLPNDNLELPGDTEAENYGDLEESIATQIALNTRGTDFGEPVIQDAIRDAVDAAQRRVVIGQVKGLTAQGRYDAADGWLEKHRDIAGTEYAAMKNTVRVARDGETSARLASGALDRRTLMSMEEYNNLPATARVSTQELQIKLAGYDNKQVDIDEEASKDAAVAVAAVIYQRDGANMAVVDDVADQQGWDAPFRDNVAQEMTRLEKNSQEAYTQSADAFVDNARFQFKATFPNGTRHQELEFVLRQINGSPPEYRKALLLKAHTMQTEKSKIEFDQDVTEIYGLLKGDSLLEQQDALAELPLAYRKPVADALKAHNEDLENARKNTNEKQQEDAETISRIVAGQWNGDGSLHSIDAADRAGGQLLFNAVNMKTTDRVSSNLEIEEFDKLSLSQLRRMSPIEVWDMTSNVKGANRSKLNKHYRYALEGGESRERKFTDIEKNITSVALRAIYEREKRDLDDEDVRIQFSRDLEEIYARMPDGPGEITTEMAEEVANRVFYQPVEEVGYFFGDKFSGPQALTTNTDFSKLELTEGPSRHVKKTVDILIAETGKGLQPTEEVKNYLMVLQTIIDSTANNAVIDKARSEKQKVIDDIDDTWNREIYVRDPEPGVTGP